MAMGEEWTEWHLTPRGWERGSERHDGVSPVRRETPADTALTMRYHDYLGAPNALKERWRSQDAATVERLLAQYGQAPESL